MIKLDIITLILVFILTFVLWIMAGYGIYLDIFIE